MQIIVKYIYLTPRDGTLTGTVSQGQRGSGSNGNEEVINIL